MAISQIEMIIYIIIAGLFLAVLGSLLTWWLLRRRYRHIRYIIRWQRGDKVQVQEDKARLIKGPKLNYWHLQRNKINVVIPPKEALDFRKDGKIWTEAYWSEDLSTITPIKIHAQNIQGVKIATPSQKLLLANEIELANKSGLGFWNQYGGMVIGGGVLIVLFVLLFVFWADLLKPAQEFAGAMQGVANKLDIVTERLQQMEAGQQIIVAPPE